MIEKNISIPEVEDQITIWRYMDFATFYSLLVNKSLFFRRLDKQTDKLEGVPNETLIDDLYRKWKSFEFSGSESKEKATKEYEHIVSYKQFTLANSWTIAKNESYALWKIYLRGSNEGVAIKTTVKRLKDSLASNECHINVPKVNYDESKLKLENLNQHNVATYKRKSYNYENELRVYMLNQFRNGINEKGNQDKIPLYEAGKNVEVDLDLLLDEVYISPFCGNWFRSVVESAIANILNQRTLKIVSSEINDG